MTKTEDGEKREKKKEVGYFGLSATEREGGEVGKTTAQSNGERKRESQLPAAPGGTKKNDLKTRFPKQTHTSDRWQGRTIELVETNSLKAGSK